MKTLDFLFYVTDNFLSDEFLKETNIFFRCANIFKRPYPRGYIGTFLNTGMSSISMLLFSQELKNTFKGIFHDNQLSQAWAFKYDSEQKGISIHADDANVNVNFWITADESNLDKDNKPLIRLGFRIIKGISKKSIQSVLSADKPFTSLDDLTFKTGLSKANLSLLSSAGALNSITDNRRQAHWQALAQKSSKQLLSNTTQDSHTSLGKPSESDNVYSDYNSTGLTLGRHPMSLIRDQFPAFRQYKRYADLMGMGNQRFIRIAGIVTGKQRPGTASGVVFLTLEDETGNSNIVIWKSVQHKFRQALLKAQLLLVKGIVESDGAVIHIIAQELVDCSELFYKTKIRSRNFR